MKQEIIKTKIVKVEDLGNLEIGEDRPQISAKSCLVTNYKIEMIKDSTNKEIGNKLTLIVEHPDVDGKTIDISGLKYEQNGKIKQSGLWVKSDQDGKLPYKSAVANLLRFLRKKTIKDIVGEQINTILDENGYLLIKAY